MKRGARKPDSKWGRILDLAAALKADETLIVGGDQTFANRLRAMLHVSNVTMRWRFTVRRDSGIETGWEIKKVGAWR